MEKNYVFKKKKKSMPNCSCCPRFEETLFLVYKVYKKKNIGMIDQILP